MASRVGGGVVHDQTLNIQYNENSAALKTSVSKASKKGGRTALGDLSNTMKPSLIPTASKKPNPAGVFSLAEKETQATQILRGGGKKQSGSKPPVKLQGGGRKALSDISNSGKPTVNLQSKNAKNTKLSVVAEEIFHPSGAIEEEIFLHNHQECIKAQSQTMDMDDFLQIVGLHKSDLSKGLATPQACPNSLDFEAKSSLKHLELSEVTEELMDDQSSKPESPLHCSTPTSPKNHMPWMMEHDYIKFTLMESPEFAKKC